MIVTWKYARENFADVVNAVRYRNERVIITRHGKAVVDIVPTAEAAESAGPTRVTSLPAREAIL